MRNCDVAEGEIVRIINTGKMYSGDWINEELHKCFPDLPDGHYPIGHNDWYGRKIREPDEEFVVYAVGIHPYYTNRETEIALLKGEDQYFYVIGTEGIAPEIIIDAEEFNLDELF